MRHTRLRIGRYSTIILLGLIIAFPMLYLLSGSLMSFNDIAQYPPRLFPTTPIWDNFAQAWSYLTPRTIFNTFAFVGSVLLIQLAICLPAGFALSKIKFRGSKIVFGLFLVPVLLPTNLLLIPTFVVTLQLGLVGNFFGLVLPIAGQASVGVLLFRQFFSTLPDGLIEAARIDGAGWFRTFFSIALPLARPIVAAYSVVTFLTAWNLYIWPLLVAPGEQTRVLTLALAPLATTQFSNISPSVGFAAAVIAMVPVLVVFVVFQKWFTRGITGTGLE
ncbi:carbohydrate ABC transporter permease [Lacisediminihabitans profunda]|uniref:Carbohydrate ABC transporter permease n=1 Tax=Lacisediminihabitans profunda TaxID=2594790 RepID=A0A5C8UNN4_9MICO|nr:carbohydrate ABC transporter permease [Lacisediminihabitans profunda]TXN29478.1 carbohydrate ABC transporter permease [Lacisediminihabitans profunda]